MSVLQRCLYSMTRICKHCFIAGRTPVLLRCALGLIVGMGLSACSSSSSESEVVGPAIDSTQQPADLETAQEAQTLVPVALLQFEDDPGLLNEIPNIAASEVTADTGLQVVYTEQSQIDRISALDIEAHWVQMQACLELVTSPPVVIITSDFVQPFTAIDDVIRDIQGSPIASSSVRDDPIIQIIEADFDGSLGTAGFNLRSIMGRLLWLSAGLAERNYRYECAREQTTAEAFP